MIDNANETYDSAPEDVRDRKQVRSQKDFEPLLDTEEAARLLRMHPRTLRTKARRGSIPAVQVGKRWRFRASMLDRWLGKLAS
jgi:excisionase family DNA binding protein